MIGEGIVPSDVGPTVQSRDAQVLGEPWDLDRVFCNPERLDVVVDHDAFLEGDPLATDGKAEIKAVSVVGVDSRKQLASIAFKKQSLDIGIQRVHETGALSVDMQQAGAQIASLREGSKSNHNPFGRRELQVAEDIGRSRHILPAGVDAIVEGPRAGLKIAEHPKSRLPHRARG